VNFPYPVVPIVRAHHEKWDGTGYPDGLAGEAIPIGARILAAIDCFDALASDRQYRKALPLDEAMAMVAAEAGTGFDPRVIAVLRSRYVELEKIATEQPLQASPRLRTELKVKRGSRPAAGFAEPAQEQNNLGGGWRTRVSFAKKLCDEIIQISRSSGAAISIEDIGALISLRLKHSIWYDTFALYCVNDGVLIPAFVIGKSSEGLASLRIPLGEGLSGWVAENGKLILNGNPSVEPGYPNDPAPDGSLRSALVMPLGVQPGRGSVLALYRAPEDAFTADDLHVFEAIRAGLESAVSEAQRPKAYEASSRS